MFPDQGEFEGVFSMESGGRVAGEPEPFFILLMGDWAGDSVSRPLDVDRDNFAEVFRRCRPSVRLGFEGTTEELLIEFEELDDFHPDNLFRNVNVFKELRDIRSRLRSPETFDRAANEVRSWFERPESIQTSGNAVEQSPRTASEDLLGEILDSAVYSREDASETELGRFVSKIVEPYMVRVDEDEQTRLTEWIDDSIGDLMRRILHHSEFQRVESAWRGLYFLVRRIETDRDLRVFIWDVPKRRLGDKLKDVNELAESEIFQTLIGDDESGRRFSVIGGNYEFEPDVEDIATLIRMASICNAAGIPFVSYMRPTTFSDRPLGESFDEGQLLFSEQTREGKLWNALRQNEASRSLGLCVQRVLGRLPYGVKTDELEAFSFEEFDENISAANYLWINPAFSLTLLIAGSYRMYQEDIWGRLANEVGKLPVHTYLEDGEAKTRAVAEVVLTERAAEILVENGVIALAAFRDSDRFRVVRWQSISSPPTILGG